MNGTPVRAAPSLRLMAVLAHPDDESLGVGGTLAKYASEGVQVSIVTATRGERGRHATADVHPGPEAMGRIREAELRAAAAALGVEDVSFLGYLDQDLDRADPRQAIGRIVSHLRRARPHVVVTFAPDGAYGHPDHIAICQFTTAAVVAAADPRWEPAGDDTAEPHRVSKLYYMAWGEAAWAAYQAAFKVLVSRVDGVERHATPWPDWAITTRIDTRAHWPAVWRAVCCHESQVANYARLGQLSPEHHEALWGVQEFYRAFSLVNGGRTPETDVFDGLR
ncbi:MAG: PIG-L family deacetylase [Vicinamibacterales bacterium]|nr:PIG-L family deacetylase [Vicinamibacterales bacterium]